MFSNSKLLLLIAIPVTLLPSCKKEKPKPNILLVIADDWSWPHSSHSGNHFIQTPNIDSLSRHGIVFTNAFVTSPSCSPSRASILTGQWHWRLGEGVNLWSALDPKYDVYPDLLEKEGYQVGYTGKGWGPGDWKSLGRTRNPAGPVYNDITLEPPYSGISKLNYAKNFEVFLNKRSRTQPFCFWYGAIEPHRVYEKGSGIKAGKDISAVDVPACLPDVEEVRNDLLDYAVEVEWFDSQLGLMIQKLEEIGELDQTIIVVTGDNGLPFPRAKTNLYDIGTHVPLIVFWPDKILQNHAITDFISLQDLAPTFLDIAGLKPPDDMTGRSIMPLILSDRSGRIDATRDHVLSGRERHTPAQPDRKSGYPMRAIRTDSFLYIRNFEPDRWPVGLMDCSLRPFMDIDASPTKDYMIEHQTDADCIKLFTLGFLKRPLEELYDLSEDPGEFNNLADSTAFSSIKKALSEQLMKELKETNDPRLVGGAEKINEYPYYGNRDY